VTRQATATVARARRRSLERSRTTARPSRSWAARKTLKKGSAAARTAAVTSQPRPSPERNLWTATRQPMASARAGTTEFANTSERSKLPRSSSVHQRAAGSPARMKEKSVASRLHGTSVTTSGGAPIALAIALAARIRASAQSVTSKR
jgi:hypothetical protein